MATLKGLFDPKPRSQRNFLLENKRDIKTKSTINSRKQKKDSNVIQKQRIPLSSSKSMSPLRTALENSATSQRQKHKRVDLNHPLTKCQPAKMASSGKLKPSSSEVKPTKDGLISKPTSISRTTHYIHKENVPFEWTEVCPSLISHNICHQGVQTDRNEKYDNTHDSQIKSFDLTDECEKKHVQINKHSMDSASDQTTANRDKRVDSKEEEGPENFHNDLEGNAHSIALNGFGEHQVSHVPIKQSSNLISEVENLKLSPSRKFMSNAKGPTSTMVCPPSYRKGVVPGYISKRKTEALASARAKEVDPNCPLGHVVMPDDERRETLDMILKNYNQLIAELNKIPVRTDTLKMKQRKIEIEKQLDKLEEGLRIFSRSKVYVKMDA